MEVIIILVLFKSFIKIIFIVVDRFGKGLNSPVEIIIKTTDDLQSFYNPSTEQKIKKRKKYKTPTNKSQIGFLSQSSLFPHDKKLKSNNNNINDSGKKNINILSF